MNNTYPTYPTVPTVPNYPNFQRFNPQYQEPNQGLIWVQGESGAKSWIVNPNTTVLLMDSESNQFYLKSADSAGLPTLRAFEYKEITKTVKSSETDEDIPTREEFNALSERINEIAQKIDEMSKPVEKKTTRKAAQNDEE